MPRRHPTCRAAAGAIVLCASLASSAGAQTFLGPTPYLQQSNSPFLVDITSGSMVLENFEDGLLNTPGVTASAGNPLAPSGITDSVDGDDGAVDGSGTGGNSFFSGSGAAGIRFTFNTAAPGGSLPTGAGIVWTDGSGTTSFEAFGPGNVSLGTIGPVTIADGSNNGTTGEDHFFGVASPGGIESIFISNTGGGIEVDHLQYGQTTIPEPGSVAVLAAIAAIASTRRRRRL